MFKLQKKIYSILMFVAVLFFFVINVHAEENEHIVPLEKATQQAKNYFGIIKKNSDSNWKDSELLLDRALYDTHKQLTAYLFVVYQSQKENGFIIVSANNKIPGVLESTRKGNNPYYGVDKGNSIYVGPLSYFQKATNENSYRDLNTNKKLSQEALENVNVLSNSESISTKNKSLYKANNLMQKGSIPNFNHKYISNVPDFEWTHGCLPTAYANVTVYWANNGFPRLKSNRTDYETYILDTFPKLMKTDAQGNSFGHNGIAGAKEYWNKTGKYSISIKEYKNKPVNPNIFKEYKKEIDKNRPAIITTQTHPIYNNHAVTGVGYEEIFDPAEKVWYRTAIVHDEWLATPQDHYLVWTPDIDSFYSVIPGVDLMGWILDGKNQWRFYESLGVMKTGWAQDKGNWYYMDGSGVMKTGWVQDKGNWYYMDGSGVMKTGWVQDNNKWYYMNTSGQMLANGWITDNGKSYYLRVDGSWDESKTL